MRHSRRETPAAASAASSVAPCSTPETNGTQSPVGPDARKMNVANRRTRTIPNR
jgi:hypothetical protein